MNCIDGVILVADTKFIINGGSNFDYDYKITGELRGVLTAFAGNREPFEDFRAHLREYGVETQNKTDHKNKKYNAFIRCALWKSLQF
ncbi:MAG: hypothetical protein ACJ72X_12810 [Nitrososphaeraceae archaeon]